MLHTYDIHLSTNGSNLYMSKSPFLTPFFQIHNIGPRMSIKVFWLWPATFNVWVNAVRKCAVGQSVAGQRAVHASNKEL
jgi:hypothetical protein